MTINFDALPAAIREHVQEEITKYGEWHVSHMLHLAPIGRMLTELQASDNDICWRIVVLQILNALATEDPTPIHFTLARDRLEAENIKDKKALDILSRELVNACQKLKGAIFEKQIDVGSEIIDILLEDEEGALYLPHSREYPEIICEQDECNAFDLKAAKVFKNFGDKGKEQAKKIEDSAKDRFRQYRESQYSESYRSDAWSLWITTEPSVFMPVLRALTEIVWADVCQQQWERKTRQVPAVATAVLTTAIKPPLSKNGMINVTETSIYCYSSDGKVIASVPCIEPTLVPLLKRGMQGFSTLTGHKLLRWEVKTGFNQWADGKDDFRRISSSGGYEGVAHQIGCGSGKNYSTDVKAILHAQAHGLFQFPQGGSGNMIALREDEWLRNGEPSQIIIVLGDILVPNFAHRLPKGEPRRLVPITDLPPLIGSANTHAAQAMLQLLVLEEFANQSDVLSERRCIHLSEEKWEELATQARLPRSSLIRVIIGWTEDDLFSKAFLDKQGNEYSLGPAYANVLDFLKYQGQRRISGSKGADKGNQVKKSRAKHGYKRPPNKDKS